MDSGAVALQHTPPMHEAKNGRSIDLRELPLANKQLKQTSRQQLIFVTVPAARAHGHARQRRQRRGPPCPAAAECDAIHIDVGRPAGKPIHKLTACLYGQRALALASI